MTRIDETINKMQGFIKELEDETTKHIASLSEDGKAKAKEFKDRTISTINSSIDKLNSMKSSITDENELEDFLNRLEAKCKDVTDFTKVKINEIKPIVQDNLKEIKEDIEKGFDDFKEDLNETKNEATNTFDKLLENENIKNAIKLAKSAKDKAVEFYNDPKTQKAINEAKLKAIELADKGLDKLKEALDRKENKED